MKLGDNKSVGAIATGVVALSFVAAAIVGPHSTFVKKTQTLRMQSGAHVLVQCATDRGLHFVPKMNDPANGDLYCDATTPPLTGTTSTTAP